MKGRITINRLFAALGLLMLVALFAPASLAQNQKLPADRVFYSVTVTRVKPEMVTEYREFMKNETLAAYKKAGGKEWATWTMAVFGESGEFWSVRPATGELKQFDEPSFIIKALGEQGARAWSAKRARMIVSARSMLLVARPDLMIAPKSETPKLGIGIRESVTPGRDAEYVKGLKEAIALGPKTNVKGVFVSKLLFGGDFNEYYTLVLLDSFADIDSFFASFGKAAQEAKLAPPTVGVVKHSEWTVFRYVPELSIQLPALKAVNK